MRPFILDERINQIYSIEDLISYLYLKYSNTIEQIKDLYNNIAKLSKNLNLGVDSYAYIINEMIEYIRQNGKAITESYNKSFKSSYSVDELVDYFVNRLIMYSKLVEVDVERFFENIKKASSKKELEIFLDQLRSAATKSEVLSLGESDEWFIRFINTNIFAPNSEFIARIKEVMQESAQQEKQVKQENEGDKDQDSKKQRDYAEIDNLIERIRSKYQSMIEENNKKIESIKQEIAKIKDKKNKNETFDYERSKSKDLYKYNVRNFWNTITQPIKDVVDDLYRDIKRSTPIARLFEFMFKSSLKLAKFIDKRFGIGLLDTSKSGFWAKLRNKINERKQKRKLEQLERLKTYYERNFGDIAEKEIKKDISEGLYKKDYNSLDDDKKQKVDSIYQSIINARLEQAAILEKVINENIENDKKISTSEVLDHQEEKKDRNEQKVSKKKNIVSKLKSRINKLRDKSAEQFRKIRDIANKFTKKAAIFRRKKAEKEKDADREKQMQQLKECQVITQPSAIQENQNKEEKKNKYQILKDKISDRIKNTFDKVRNVFGRKKKKERIENQENNNTVIQESCDPSEVIEKLEEVSDRDRKVRFKLRKITRNLRKRFNIKKVFKRFKLKRPEFIKKGVDRIRGLSRIGTKMPRLKLPKPNLSKPFRSIGKLIYGNKSAQVSRVAGSGLSRGFQKISSRLGSAGRAIGSRVLGGARALSGLRTVGTLFRVGRIVPALGALLASPVGIAIVVIVAIIAIVAAVYYVMFMFKKFMALFKPTIEYSAAKAIEEYKEMKALSQIENKEDLRSKLSNIAKTPVTAENLGKTSTFVNLSAGNLEDKNKYLVSADNNTKAQMRRPDTPYDYDMSQVGKGREKRQFKQPWETSTEETEETMSDKRVKRTTEEENTQEEDQSTTVMEDSTNARLSRYEQVSPSESKIGQEQKGVDVKAAVDGAIVEMQKYTASVVYLSDQTVKDRAKIKKEKNKRRKKQQDMEI